MVPCHHAFTAAAPARTRSRRATSSDAATAVGYRLVVLALLARQRERDREAVRDLVNLVAEVWYAVGIWLRNVQTGYIRSYILFLALAAMAKARPTMKATFWPRKAMPSSTAASIMPSARNRWEGGTSSPPASAATVATLPP